MLNHFRSDPFLVISSLLIHILSVKTIQIKPWLIHGLTFPLISLETSCGKQIWGSAAPCFTYNHRMTCTWKCSQRLAKREAIAVPVHFLIRYCETKSKLFFKTLLKKPQYLAKSSYLTKSFININMSSTATFMNREATLKLTSKSVGFNVRLFISFTKGFVLKWSYWYY